MAAFPYTRYVHKRRTDRPTQGSLLKRLRALKSPVAIRGKKIEETPLLVCLFRLSAYLAMGAEKRNQLGNLYAG